MYRDYFGLQREPFGMTPDPACLQVTRTQREALAALVYAILARRGFAALIGDAGTGKTTLLNKLMRLLDTNRASFSFIMNPTLSVSEFLESVLMDFGVEHVPVSKAQRLAALNKLLLHEEECGRIPVLIVDEAHKLNADVLEEIRLLSNFERPEGKLLHIVLAGQPELGDLLDSSDLRQLKQRIAVRVRIGRFTDAELKSYIAHRWRHAGGAEDPFDVAAVELIMQYSKGIPRIANSICDNSLMLAMADGIRIVTATHALEAARDLCLIPEAVRAPGADSLDAHASDATAVPARPRADVNGASKTALSTAIEEPVGIPTLERYDRSPEHGSVLGRLFARLWWAN